MQRLDNLKVHSTYNTNPYKNTYSQIRKQKTAAASLSSSLSAPMPTDPLTVQPWQRAVVL